jgi:hypothetical protein
LWQVEVRRWAGLSPAWGERAADWAYLAEPDACRVNDALFDRAGVGAGTGCWISPVVLAMPLTSRLAVGPRCAGWMPLRR